MGLFASVLERSLSETLLVEQGGGIEQPGPWAVVVVPPEVVYLVSAQAQTGRASPELALRDNLCCL